MTDQTDPFTLEIVRDERGVRAHLPSLTKLLRTSVNDESGPTPSSLGFFTPLSEEIAADHWTSSLLSDLTGPSATASLLVLTVPGEDDLRPGRVVAAVQIHRYAKETHAYKAEIRKLLVDTAYRRRGLGRRMMEAAEQHAAELGVEMLLLDTASETPARQFYLDLGWTEWGVCPEYAKSADGRKADCSFFYKKL